MPLKVIAGRRGITLAKKICRILNLPICETEIRNFADGEIFVRIKESVRGSDVFVIQSTPPPADNIWELLLIIDALKRASAERITAVIPYFGYARQDRKDEPRVPISAKLHADLLEKAGASRILTMELHAEQIQGFFNIPVDHLYSANVFVEYFKNRNLNNYVVVSPDTGGVKRTRAFAQRLRKKIPMAIIDKRREKVTRKKGKEETVEVMNLIGDVNKKSCIIFDDIISTGETLIKAANFLKDNGAEEIIACAAHALLAENCPERLLGSPLSEILVSDTIDLPKEKLNEKIKVLSVAPLFAEAIRRIHKGMSVASLFS
uniref:Ribose-phosphate pyrophosphokinase n=1 Tax=candidate division WOR-3 bacterium TaxID=2052148 RepID=A0A7C3YNU6_UNCW3